MSTPLICIWPFLSLHNSRCHGQCRLSNCPIIHWDISAVCEAPMCWLCGSSTIWGLSCISICVCPVTARTSRSSSPQSKHLTQLWSLRLHPRTQTPPAHWGGTWGLGGSFEHRIEWQYLYDEGKDRFFQLERKKDECLLVRIFTLVMFLDPEQYELTNVHSQAHGHVS